MELSVCGGILAVVGIYIHILCAALPRGKRIKTSLCSLCPIPSIHERFLSHICHFLQAE